MVATQCSGTWHVYLDVKKEKKEEGGGQAAEKQSIMMVFVRPRRVVRATQNENCR